MDTGRRKHLAAPNRSRPATRRAAAAAVLGSVAALGGAGSAAAQTTGHRTTDGQRRQSRRVDTLPAGERALLGRVFGALSAQAPEIAEPFLAEGVLDGTITAAQAERFLTRLASVGVPEPADVAGAGGSPPATGRIPSLVPEPADVAGAGGSPPATGRIPSRVPEPADVAGAGGSPPASPAAAALFQRVFAAIQAQLPVVAAPILSAGLADGTIGEPQAARLSGRFSRGPRLGFGLVMRQAQAIGATRLP